MLTRAGGVGVVEGCVAKPEDEVVERSGIDEEATRLGVFLGKVEDELLGKACDELTEAEASPEDEAVLGRVVEERPCADEETVLNATTEAGVLTVTVSVMVAEALVSVAVVVDSLEDARGPELVYNKQVQAELTACTERLQFSR